jgi:DNA-binding transcriptional LysR family regulator
MVLTDEQVIDAFLEEKSMRKAAIRLGISNEALSQRLHRMRLYGVKIIIRNHPAHKYTSEKVRQLNEYIQNKKAKRDAANT